MKIGILGFGSVGQKLAKLFADAGHEVSIGLRNNADAQNNSAYRFGSFAEVAANVDALALAIPYKASLDALNNLASALEDKIIIDNTNPLNDDWSPLLLGQENSAGETIQAALPKSHVVKAFNTIFADVMQKEAHSRNGQNITAFIAGNNDEAKNTVMELAQAVGFSPLDTGDISSSRYLEAMAHLNIRIAVPLGGGTNAAFLYHQA
ncbi:NADPH-dependent F420 reductase [Hydromonas duriensis]|uniref:Pyrroline-5-carboxylate reductase catalytic N-terminal domain-containing protein n=1 Tax=Hydromonas duriensis TaxID=1527608 RepID=A0A4R6Y8C4_9BURK|nr:NADPH-dependent F420 reductase [Hydromonas duriensis]TDR31628.1 hypothetical protein DFR44_10810 [Hydromonas duriensis]